MIKAKFKPSRLLVLALVAFSSAWGRADDHDAVVSEIRSILDPLVNEQMLPGYYLGVFDENSALFEVSMGSTRESGALPPSGDVLYAIMSMTKPIVSFAVLRLIDEGRLQLDDPVAKYIPEFTSLTVVDEGDLDEVQEEIDRPITIRDLLRHTSGFTYSEDIVGREEVAKLYAELGIFPLDEPADGTLPTLSDHISALAQLPLVAQPGQQFIYSVSIDVLGRVLEIVERKPLDGVLREWVLEPLGMTSTYFVVPPDEEKRLAQMYRPRVATYPIPGVYKRYQPYEVGEGRVNFGLKPDRLLSGGAGLISSANDYAKFLQMLMAGGLWQGTRLLSEEASESLFEHQLPDHLGSNALVYNFGPRTKGSGFSFGLGIQTKGTGNPQLTADHDYYVWYGAANTGFWIDRDNGLIGVFMAQHIPSQYDMVPELVDIVRKIKLQGD